MEDVKQEQLEKFAAKTTFNMPLVLAQELVDYLQKRPFFEVHILIAKLIEASNNNKGVL